MNCHAIKQVLNPILSPAKKIRAFLHFEMVRRDNGISG